MGSDRPDGRLGLEVVSAMCISLLPFRMFLISIIAMHPLSKSLVYDAASNNGH